MRHGVKHYSLGLDFIGFIIKRLQNENVYKNKCRFSQQP